MQRKCILDSLAMAKDASQYQFLSDFVYARFVFFSYANDFFPQHVRIFYHLGGRILLHISVIK